MKKIGIALLLFVVVFGLSEVYKFQIKKRIEVIEKLPKEKPFGEMRILGSNKMMDYYAGMNVRTPSELLRKEINSFLFFNKENNDREKDQILQKMEHMVDSYPAANNLVDHGRLARLVFLLKETGDSRCILIAKKLLAKSLGEEVSNFPQGLDILGKKSQQHFDRLDVKNPENILSLIVIDFLVNGSISENGKELVRKSFESTDFNVIEKSFDVGHLYIWQLIGIYDVDNYSKFIKNQLNKSYKEMMQYKDARTPRLMESHLLFMEHQ